MKTAIAFFTPVIAAIIAIAIIGIQVSKERDLQQTTINALRKRNKAEKDSLTNVLTATRDSLQIAFETIRQATKEREEAHARTQKTIRDLQRIVYIKYESDSARLSAIKKLYSSWR